MICNGGYNALHLRVVAALVFPINLLNAQYSYGVCIRNKFGIK